MIKNIPAYEFDWGHITAEALDRSKNEVSVIFNCDLNNETNKINTVQYVIGRLCWGAIHFPEDVQIRVTFDIRGQEIIVSRSSKFKNIIMDRLEKLGVKQVQIDFLK